MGAVNNKGDNDMNIKEISPPVAIAIAVVVLIIIIGIGAWYLGHRPGPSLGQSDQSYAKQQYNKVYPGQSYPGSGGAPAAPPAGH